MTSCLHKERIDALTLLVTELVTLKRLLMPRKTMWSGMPIFFQLRQVPNRAAISTWAHLPAHKGLFTSVNSCNNVFFHDHNVSASCSYLDIYSSFVRSCKEVFHIDLQWLIDMVWMRNQEVSKNEEHEEFLFILRALRLLRG